MENNSKSIDQSACANKIEDNSKYTVYVECDELAYDMPDLHCYLYKDLPESLYWGTGSSGRSKYLVLETVLDYYSLRPEKGGPDMLNYLAERGFDVDAVNHAVGRSNDSYTTLYHGRHDVRSYRMPVIPSKFVEWAVRARKVGNLELEDVDNGDMYMPQSWMEEAKGLRDSEISWVARTGVGSFKILKAEDITGAKAVTMVVSTVTDRIDLIEIELCDGSVRSFRPYKVEYHNVGYGDYGMYDCKFPDLTTNK